MKVFLEYITQDYEYTIVGEVPENVAHLWLRQSKAFKEGMLTYYQIGPASDDEERELRWMNKGAIRVDLLRSSCDELWLYKHDFTYYVVRPRG